MGPQGRCRDASLRGLRTGRRRRSFRGGGEAAGWGERVCRCGNGDWAGAVLRGLRTGRWWCSFRGGDVSGAETRRWAGVRVGCPFRVICPEGALRSTLPYGAGCAVRGRRVLCHGAEGRSGSGKENWTATGCSGRLIGRQGPHIGGGERPGEQQHVEREREGAVHAHEEEGGQQRRGYGQQQQGRRARAGKQRDAGDE